MSVRSCYTNVHYIMNNAVVVIITFTRDTSYMMLLSFSLGPLCHTLSYAAKMSLLVLTSIFLCSLIFNLYLLRRSGSSSDDVPAIQPPTAAGDSYDPDERSESIR